jgi:hypothetical protein
LSKHARTQAATKSTSVKTAVGANQSGGLAPVTTMATAPQTTRTLLATSGHVVVAPG